VQQTITQYASKRDRQPHGLSSENSLLHSPVYGWLRPKHAVSQGLMTLAEDIRPEANLLIELRQYALQRHTHIEIRG